MQEHYNNEIEDLKTSLAKMAALVDEQLERAMKSLLENDLNVIKGLKAKDLEVDAYDNLIQTQCENFLALFTPVASDLRYIMAIFLINNNLERCGDIAVNIAQRVKKTSEHHHLMIESNLVDMAKIARQMVKDSIDSFINLDVELARIVLTTDDSVDRMNKEAFKFSVSKMKDEPALVEPCSHLIVLARQIERLADHATNIAENLIFYVEGKLVTHMKKLNKKGDE
jgi:phosphate transport system protein